MPVIAITLVLLLAFVVFAKLAHSAYQRRVARWQEGKPVVDGTLTKCEPTEEAHWSTIEYVVDGHRYMITGEYEYTPADIGRTIPVVYDPKLPSHAQIREEFDPFE